MSGILGLIPRYGMPDCQLMRFVTPGAIDQVRDAVANGTKIVPDDEIAILNNAYVGGVTGIAQARSNLAGALVSQAAAMESGDMSAYADKTKIVANIRSILDRSLLSQGALIAGMPPVEAFLAHSTLCILRLQQRKLGKRLV